MWDDIKKKLIVSGRKWERSKDYFPHRCARLFCKKCGKSVGIFDMVVTNVDTHMYCDECIKEYIKPVPIELPCGTVVKDNGHSVEIKYRGSGAYSEMQVEKVCYFGNKGRYIKAKGKRYYI